MVGIDYKYIITILLISLIYLIIFVDSTFYSGEYEEFNPLIDHFGGKMREDERNFRDKNENFRQVKRDFNDLRKRVKYVGKTIEIFGKKIGEEKERERKAIEENESTEAKGAQYQQELLIEREREAKKRRERMREELERAGPIREEVAGQWRKALARGAKNELATKLVDPRWMAPIDVD